MNHNELCYKCFVLELTQSLYYRLAGVHVDIPALDSDSNVVTLRGETTRLAEALAKVYEFVSTFCA